jgi:hypothetical protein
LKNGDKGVSIICSVLVVEIFTIEGLTVSTTSAKASPVLVRKSAESSDSLDAMAEAADWTPTNPVTAMLIMMIKVNIIK